MTNKLLSEEELLEKIEGIAEYLGCNDMELANEIMPLIESQKEAFAEYVIGEDEEFIEYGNQLEAVHVGSVNGRLREQRERAGL